MRHASDALLTGIGTILADDPLLTDRSGLPRRKRLCVSFLIRSCAFRLNPGSSKRRKTICWYSLLFLRVQQKRASCKRRASKWFRAKTKNGHIDLTSVFTELGPRDILSVLLEAGPALNGAALAARVVHKLVLFYAPKIAGKSRVPFALAPRLNLPPLRDVRTQQFGPDIAIEAYLQDAYKK